MAKEAEIEVPKVRLASESWVMEKLMETEGRIEKAFHEQTRYLDQKHLRSDDKMLRLEEKIDVRFRWMAGLTLTCTVVLMAAIAAVLFKG